VGCGVVWGVGCAGGVVLCGGFVWCSAVVCGAWVGGVGFIPGSQSNHTCLRAILQEKEEKARLKSSKVEGKIDKGRSCVHGFVSE
jgi:hypothetical protein